MYKLIFFVPEADLETVKQAVFEAGAGRQGNYQECCWQTLGMGQFRPIDGANPAIGRVGKLEQVNEWRVETLCDPRVVKAAVQALLEAHPYEEVAYDLIKLEELGSL